MLLGAIAIYLAPRTPAPSQAQFLQSLEASAITVSVDRVRDNKASGSGFFISHDGLALTNAHVLVGAVSASGLTIDGNQMPAQLVGVDHADDIAELKLEGSRASTPLRLADSQPQLGEDIYVIGNPKGTLPGTITKGRVSGLDRDTTVNSVHYQHLVQLDVSVSQGNSGGPVIDSRGAVLGMLTLGTSATNQALAIPASTLKASVSQWTGLAPTDIPFPLVTTPSADLLLLQEGVTGFVITHPGSPLLSGYAGPIALSQLSTLFAEMWLREFPTVDGAQAEFKRLSAPLPQPLGYRPAQVPTIADESGFYSYGVRTPRIEGAWRDRNVVVEIVVYSSSQTALDGLVTIVQAQQQRLDEY